MDVESKAGHQHEHVHGEHVHDHTLMQEIICHLPYAIFSVALGLAVLSFLAYFTCIMCVASSAICNGGHILFHSFHFMHIVFAATGTVITYLRFGKGVLRAWLFGALSTMVFCSLSDAVLPYLAGRLLGVSMHFHLCFLSELSNVLPFLMVGLLNGFVMSRHHASRQSLYSVFSHFIHILISSFASIFYLISHGFTNWYTDIGPVFLFMVIAVVVPCTLADVVVPMTLARAGKTHEHKRH